MREEQKPLPGFEDMLGEDYLPTFMLYAVHTKLREHLATIFDGEINILREMGRLNEERCPESWYAAQRKLCMGIKDLVIQLDDLNDAMEAKIRE